MANRESRTLEIAPLQLANQAKSLDLKLIGNLFRAMPELKVFFDEEYARAQKLTDKAQQKKLSNTFRLWAELLKNSKDVPELLANISAMEQLFQLRFKENMALILEQLRDIRKTLFSVKLAYDNSPKGSIQLFPIDREAFVDQPDDTYWQALKTRLKQQFRKWDLKNAQAPCYLSFPFALDSADAARKVAEFMEEIVGMAQLSIPAFSHANLVCEFMENSFQIMSSNEQGAHIIIVGPQAYMNGVIEDYHTHKLMPIPLGPAIMGRLLNTPIGTTPSSLNGDGITGISGVTCEYDEETTKSSDFAKLGLIQVIASGKIQGTATACNGDLPVYNSFPMMDVFINVQRSLVCFANQWAHGNWGKDEKEAFASQLIKYFNDLYDNQNGGRVIEEPVTRDMIGILYNPDNKTVFVSIPIKYKGVVSKFRFTLVGENETFSRLKKRPF